MTLAVFAALALPGGAAAQRVPERVPFDAVANVAFGSGVICTGQQSVTWSRPAGQWVGTLSGSLFCPQNPVTVSGECGIGLVARDNTTLAVRPVSRNVDGIYVAMRIPGFCEPASITFDPTNPPGETLLGRFDARFDVTGGLAGPTIFCQGKSADRNTCENDIQFTPGEDVTIQFQ